MYQGLPQSYYIDAGVFASEQKNIFRKLWIFAGLRTLLGESDGFLTRTIGGVPVVIQNFDGVLKAFRNQCAHRQAPLQIGDYGRRRLVCRYHGWVFNDSGGIHSIPGEHRLYHYSDIERNEICLDEFSVQCIGNLVFVNLDKNPIPIEKQFTSELMESLAEISNCFGGQAIHASIPSAYNWKLNFENVLDYNHVPFVHPRTFRPLLHKGAANEPSVPADDLAVEYAELHELSFSGKMPLKIQPWPWHDLVKRYGDSDSYYNYFLYPNINFISVGGYIFLIQQFDPIAPDRTDVRFTLSAAKSSQRIGAMPAILWGHLKGEKRVLDEDRVILEELQKNLHHGGPVAKHGAYEAQLRRVALVYRKLMEK
ncbi:MAG: aromatic ring-hydroxylating dioxygenase subunit alpha [Delftia sp.]|jgi:phenylpropionate dioxygenase-like ring-hydroxylating dioxygenase large terminal subunit|nr:aromatic ring-hydroxylating dioxygenase subunit alpha [Delftia sp.]